MSNIIIVLLDKSNNIKEDITIIKQKFSGELLQQIIQKFKDPPENYEIFILDKNNNQIKIDNETKYNLIKDILFIRESENLLEESTFQLNYNRLPEFKQDLLEKKFKCIMCLEIVKKEKPYLCNKCEQIFHEKCLKDWDKTCKLQNNNLTCPNCRNELPLEKWEIKLDYEENRFNEGQLMAKKNEEILKKNLENSKKFIKDKKLKELINDEIKSKELIKKYEDYIEQTIEIFKNILIKINSMHSLLELNNNDKLRDLINEYPLNIKNLDINKIKNVINEELEHIEKCLINNKINLKEKHFEKEQNKKKINITQNINGEKKIILNNFDNNINDIHDKENSNKIVNGNRNEIKFDKYINKINITYYAKTKGNYDIFGKKFVENNEGNISLNINGKINNLVHNYELKEGENIITLIIKNKLINLSYMFISCESLKDIQELKDLDVKDTINFSTMFFGCSSLSDIKPLQNWDVSKGKDFSFMFWGCKSLSDIKPLQNWNVSNGNTFQSMFHGCVLLSDIKPLENWKVDNGNNFQSMFYDCSSLSDIKPLEKWNVINGNNLSNMFSYCSKLTDLKTLEKWNVSNCYDFSSMFYKCSNLKDIKPLEKWNVNNNCDFYNMFNECSPLLDIKPLQNWKVSKEKLKDVK